MKPPEFSYNLTMRLAYRDQPGQLAAITEAIGASEGSIGAVDIVEVKQGRIIRDITVHAHNTKHGERIVEQVRAIPDVEVRNVSDRTFLLHLGGKIGVRAKVKVKTRDDLSMIYTPGVARICRAIHDDPEAAFALTSRCNTVAVVTDGSAVLGMGDIGPKAALPVMEGKAVLFKEFAGVDAIPICLDTHDVDRIIDTCVCLAPSFGGINLEDISAPRCVEIEQRLSERVDIPVFHDDQHGAAIVVLAALRNALKVVGKKIGDVRVTINGAGASGAATAHLLRAAGVRTMVVCDRHGAIYSGRGQHMNPVKDALAQVTNSQQLRGSLSDVIEGSDVFIGLSDAGALSVKDLEKMAKGRIVFALANPAPEIDPDLAAPHCAVLATGRPDYPNELNNVLCFPGFFRGLLNVRAHRVTEAMKLAASGAIAGVIADEDLLRDYIVPSVFDRRVAPAVANAVAQAAIKSGVARRQRTSSFH